MQTPSMRMLAALVLLLTGIAVAFVYWGSAMQSEQSDQSAALLEQGITLYGQKKYTEALQELEKIPADSISDWHIPYYRGSSYIMLKEYEQAAMSLEQALVLSSQETGVLYALGVVYYKLGKLELARSYFAAVLEINPADEQAKGLMDIMANLERQSSEPQAESSEPATPDSQ
jgi:tetratricopeptide (TPR) repeat protein